MIKRIPCRVVRSKPLGKSGGAITSNHFHHKIGDVLTNGAQGKCTINPVRDRKAHKSALGTLTYTRLLEITSVSMDNGLAGQILDCYV